MRKVLLVCALILIAVSAQAASYAGHWTLDKARSTNLPPHYENVTSHELDITEEANVFVIGVKITSTQHEPMQMDFRYPLDGSAIHSETPIRTPAGEQKVPTTMSLRREGDTIAISIERQFPALGDGAPAKGTTFEKWHLSDDGKTLTIDRADDSPRGRREARMVFTRP